MLHNVLGNYDLFFNRALGTWKNKPIYIELQPDTNMYHAKPYPVIRLHQGILKKEVKIICQSGLL